MTEAVVSVQSTSLPFAFLSATVSTMLACGLTKFSFFSLPSRTTFFIQVVNARHGVVGLQRDAGQHESEKKDQTDSVRIIAPMRDSGRDVSN